ncbi:MAG: hypothetical protein HWE12_01885 [Oceanospirillaceae bacterium]|nr:hypothetical protein [Oceanospirillaceae bacterium]
MHFIVIIIAVVLFLYWRFFRPRQLEVIILAVLATIASMTLVAVVTDDVKLGFMFVLTIIGWSRLFVYLLTARKNSTVAKKLRQFLGR